MLQSQQHLFKQTSNNKITKQSNNPNTNQSGSYTNNIASRTHIEQYKTEENEIKQCHKQNTYIINSLRTFKPSPQTIQHQTHFLTPISREIKPVSLSNTSPKNNPSPYSGMVINTRSIAKKDASDHLSAELHITGYDPDKAIISETHLKAHHLDEVCKI